MGCTPSYLSRPRTLEGGLGGLSGVFLKAVPTREFSTDRRSSSWIPVTARVHSFDSESGDPMSRIRPTSPRLPRTTMTMSLCAQQYPGVEDLSGESDTDSSQSYRAKF